MGGRAEGGRATGVADGFLDQNALDGDPSTIYAAPVGTPLVVSFIGHDVALVSDVTITYASPPAKAPYGWPTDYSLSWPKDVEVWLSTKSATDGFVRATATPRFRASRARTWSSSPAPTDARFVKIVFPHNNGSPYGTLIDEVAVHEGRRAGYVPLLQRHARSAGARLEWKGDARSGQPCLPGARHGRRELQRASGHGATGCTRRAKSSSSSRGSPELYTPYPAARYHNPEQTLRYFGPGPGNGRVDSSIFNRVDYWPIQPDARAARRTFVPSAGVDTVVLEQVCDIKTSARATTSSRRSSRGWPTATS